MFALFNFDFVWYDLVLAFYVQPNEVFFADYIRN